MEKKKSKSKSTTVKAATVKEVKEEVVVENVKKGEKIETKKSNFSLIKLLCIVLLVVAVLTWIIPGGTFDGATFSQGTVTRTGIHELFLSCYYAINYYLVQILFIVALGIFYGVISKTKGYKALVLKASDKWKGKETLFILIHSLFIAILASILTQPLVVVVFIPLFYSIAKELKLSKLITILMTFGALSIGVMGSTYSGYGINYLAQGLDIKIAENIGTRLVILVVGYFVLNIFMLILNKKKDNAEVVNEIFVSSDDKSGKAWPYLLMFIIIFVFVVLGYVGYSTIFEIDTFTKFNTWLTTEVVIGDQPIFGYLLGAIGEFGTWDLFVLGYILMIILVFVKFFAHIKWNDLFEHALDGLKVIIKPVVLMTLAYAVFVLCYWTGMTNTITNWICNLSDKFNPYLHAISDGIASLLHVDYEYSGFALVGYYGAKYADYGSQMITMMTAMNGFMSLIAPTSLFMLIGLSLSDMSYGKWIKNIWKFLLALLLVLLLIFTVIAYL